MRFLSIILFSFLAINANAFQLKEGTALDKIIAIVGSEAIMQSDIDGELLNVMRMNPQIDPRTKELRTTILNARIDQNLIYMKAIEDSVDVPEEEVDQRWNFILQDYVRKLGSEKRLEEIYGKSISRIKFEFIGELKKNLLSEKLTQMKLGTITVSPREVDLFYEKYKDSLQQLPDQANIYHIVKYINADENVKEDAFRLAKLIRDSIIAGGDFAEFAKRHSQDPYSAVAGGELGWFDKGKLVPEFEKAALALQTNETSLPVESPFGFHIIQTMEKKKDALKTRHILIKLSRSDKERDKAKTFLNSLKDSVKVGADFESLARKFSEEKESRGFGGSVGTYPVTELPPMYKSIIDTLKPGFISEPYPYGNDPSKQGYHIVYYKERIETHKPDPKKDYKYIEQMATMEKRRNMMQVWVEELRKELYWEIIDEDYK